MKEAHRRGSLRSCRSLAVVERVYKHGNKESSLLGIVAGCNVRLEHRA